MIYQTFSYYAIVKSWNKTIYMWEYQHGQWPPCLTATLSTPRSINGPSLAISAGCGSYNRFSQFYVFILYLTHILLMWRKGWAPNSARKWQMGFYSEFNVLNSKILKFCWKQKKFCCLLLLNQSISTCFHLPKDTAMPVQVILLCHITGNNIWGYIKCRSFLTFSETSSFPLTLNL